MTQNGVPGPIIANEASSAEPAMALPVRTGANPNVLSRRAMAGRTMTAPITLANVSDPDSMAVKPNPTCSISGRR